MKKSIINNYFAQLKQAIDAMEIEEISNFVKIIETAKKTNKCVYIFGNGGSASTASHFVCDLNKGASYQKEKRHKVICLNDSTSTLMAYANDVNYDDIFVEQLRNFVEAQDVVIGISGSGNSVNVTKAIEFANECNAVTVGVTGYRGGKLKKVAMHSVNTNYDDMQISEDIHMVLVHVTMKCLNLDDESADA